MTAQDFNSEWYALCWVCFRGLRSRHSIGGAFVSGLLSC